jgi:hypothetical protein
MKTIFVVRTNVKCNRVVVGEFALDKNNNYETSLMVGRMLWSIKWKLSLPVQFRDPRGLKKIKIKKK